MRGYVPLLVCMALGALAACAPANESSTDAGPLRCGEPFVGDPAAEPVLELTVLGVDGASTPLVEGGDAQLIFPPQGGRVIFVGARAKNLDPCGVQITGAIRDTQSMQTRVDSRTVNLAVQADGWATSSDTQIASFANIPVCPNQWASTDAFDQSFEILLAVKDDTGRSATRSVHATPRCAEPDKKSECLCQCKKGYVLGQACDAPDAGAGGSGP